jgi:hypothetical protein
LSLKTSKPAKHLKKEINKYNLRNQNLLTKVITIDIKEEFQSVI